jgi:RNA polymerase sigma-70 factor (ECF subfamily)
MVHVVVDGEKMTVMPSPSDDLGVAFASLQHSLRSYLRRQVSDAAVAEDLLQDVFVKALAAISANRAPKNLPGWLYAAARTTVIDFYRSARPSSQALDDNLPDAQVNNELLHQELATCLRPLAQQLPPIYRDTLLATDFDGKTMQSLAGKQGLSLSAIKSRASRARAMLKEKLLDCCHVKMSSGTVVDYHRRSSSTCGGNCA